MEIYTLIWRKKKVRALARHLQLEVNKSIAIILHLVHMDVFGMRELNMMIEITKREERRERLKEKE